jgi:glycosyltransferase involved in cell wall biosynthesis
MSYPVVWTRCCVSVAKHEIIVEQCAPNVGDGRSDPQPYGLPQVRYLREERPGSQWARNSGLRLVQGDIVAFIDDDALADPDWLTNLAIAFETVEGVACVTGLALPAELETQAQGWFEQFGGFNKGRAFNRLIHNLTTHRMPDPLYPYLAGKFGAGVNMAFKADLFRALGGFDPAFVNGQDSEACASF